MNNLKKVLALVVAVAMFASMGFVASAAGYDDVATSASYADAVNLLSNLGIIQGFEDGTFRPDETLTRAQAAAIMVRMLGLEDSAVKGNTVFTDVPADHWASGYINVASTSGIIRGMGDGTFLPEASVTYEQIVKMIVCALGYEKAAEGNGGYPAGYLFMAAANKTGIAQGAPGAVGQAASRATVAKLVYNALEVELMDQTSYSTGIIGDTWQVLRGHTVLSDYLDLEKVDGVILQTYLSNAQYEDGDNTVSLYVTKNYANDYYVDYDYAVDETIVAVADKTDAATLLGYTVVAYVGENENGDDEIFAVTAKAGRNTVTTIDTELTDKFELNNGEEPGLVEYFKSSSSRSTTKAEIDGTVGSKNNKLVVDNLVVNGFNTGYSKVINDFDYTDVEEITYLDNDNDGDFEFIFVTVVTDSAKEFVVDEIDDEYYAISGESDSVELDFDDPDQLITIIKDGVIADFNSIVEGDVVTILDENVSVKTVYVSSVSVEGYVDETDDSDDTYTISGRDYKISPISAETVGEITAGDEGRFYINYAGKIAYKDTINSISGADYVYIIDADNAAGDFGKSTLKVKLFDANGALKVLEIKEKKVNYYDAEGEGKHEKVDGLDLFGAIENYTGIAKIDTNASGQITSLYLPGYEKFVEKKTYETDADAKSRKYSASRNTYGVIQLASNTVVFNVDSREAETGDLEDAITVSTVGGMLVDGTSYSFTAYGDDKFEVAEAIVTTDAKTAFDPEAPVMVVTQKRTVVSGDDTTYRITGIRAGQTVSITVDPDEYTSAENVEKGNIIVYSVDATGFARDIDVLLATSYNNGVDVTPKSEDADIVTEVTDDAVSIHFGEIVEKTNTFFMLEGVDSEFVAATDGCNYVLVELVGKDINIRAASASAVRKSTDGHPVYAFVKTVEDSEIEVSDVVVFRYFNEAE